MMFSPCWCFHQQAIKPFYEAYSLRSVMRWPSAKSVDRCDAAAVCDAIAPIKVPDDDDQKKTMNVQVHVVCEDTNHG